MITDIIHNISKDFLVPVYIFIVDFFGGNRTVANIFIFVFFINLVSSLFDDKEYEKLHIVLAQPSKEALKKHFENMSQELSQLDDGDSRVREKAKSAILKAVGTFSESLLHIHSKLNGHAQHVLNTMTGRYASTKDIETGIPGLRVWRISGALLSLVALVIFILSDFSMGLNVVAALFPDVKPPEHFTFLASVSLPIIISSVVTALMLGLILIDTKGVTHFIPWEGLRPQKGETNKNTTGLEVTSIRRSVFWISSVMLFIHIVLLFFSSLVRIPSALSLVDLHNLSYPWLNEQIINSYTSIVQLVGGVALTLTYIPMILTTILLFWGITGILVIYTCIIFTLSFIFYLIGNFVKFVDYLLAVISPVGGLFIHIVIGVLLFTLTIIGLITGSVLFMVRALTNVFVRVVQVLTSPSSFFIAKVKSSKQHNSVN